MRYAKRTYLGIPRPVAVQKQQIGNSIIALSDCDAFVADHRNTSHHGDRATLLLEISHRRWREQIGRRAKVHNRWLQF